MLASYVFQYTNAFTLVTCRTQIMLHILEHYVYSAACCEALCSYSGQQASFMSLVDLSIH